MLTADCRLQGERSVPWFAALSLTRKATALNISSIFNRTRFFDLLLYVVGFTGAFGYGLTIVPLPLLTLNLGGNVLTLGWLGAITALVYTCGCLLVGPVVRYLPARGIAIAGAAVTGAAYVLLSFAQTVPLLFQAAVLSAAGMSIFWVPMQTWLGERGDARNLQRRTAAYNMSWCSGMTVGVRFGGTLFERGAQWPFWLAAAAVCCGMLLIIATLAANGGNRTDSRHASSARDGEDLARTERLLKVVWIAQFSVWFIYAMIRSIWPKLAVDMGFDADEISRFLFALPLVQAITFGLMGILHWWRFKRYLLYAAQMTACVVTVVIGLTSDPLVLYIAFGLFGMILALVHSSSTYYSLFRLERRGIRASIHEGLIGSGAFIGPLFGGILAKLVALPLPFVLTPLVIIAAIVGEEKLFHRHKPSG